MPGEIFDSSRLFLFDEAQDGLRYLMGSAELPERETMLRTIDDIREHMYIHAGPVFANLESLAYAAKTRSDEYGDAGYLAVLTGGALAYAGSWYSIGEELEELPVAIAEQQGFWSPEQINTVADITWSARAMFIGRQEWDRDPVLRAIVERYSPVTVDEPERQLCADAAGFVKRSLAVTNTYNNEQNAWITRQIAHLERGTST